MLKTRIILIVASAVVVWLIFLLPKAVVENENQLKPVDSASAKKDSHLPTSHTSASPAIVSLINVAMTYLSTGGPMQGISRLKDVLSEDPKNELALFNMSMLSVQSGQNKKAIDWLKQLAEVNPKHVQGQMLLGVAFMNDGQKNEARAQFERVKKMDNDPAVQAKVDSYLKDMK